MDTTPGKLLVNGVLAIADVGVLPGSSQLLEGNIKSGMLHAIGGIAAGAIFGPIGWIAVGANAFSKTISGKSLYHNFASEKGD